LLFLLLYLTRFSNRCLTIRILKLFICLNIMHGRIVFLLMHGVIEAGYGLRALADCRGDIGSCLFKVLTPSLVQVDAFLFVLVVTKTRCYLLFELLQISLTKFLCHYIKLRCHGASHRFKNTIDHVLEILSWLLFKAC